MPEAGELTLKGKVDTSGMKEDLEGFQQEVGGGEGMNIPMLGNVGTMGMITGVLGGIVGLASQMEGIRDAFGGAETSVGEAMAKPSEQIKEITDIQQDLIKAEKGVFSADRRRAQEDLQRLTSEEGEEGFKELLEVSEMGKEVWHDFRAKFGLGEADEDTSNEQRPAQIGSKTFDVLEQMGAPFPGFPQLTDWIASLFSNGNETEKNVASKDEQGVIVIT